MSGQGVWETTLHARDLDDDGTVDAYFDTTTNITWLKDAARQGPVGPYGDGRVNHADASAWVSSLEIGAVGGWRLPGVYIEPDAELPPSIYTYAGDGWFSELGHMFYVTLGNLGFCAPDVSAGCIAQSGAGLTNTGPFDVPGPDYYYWSGREVGPGYFWYMLTLNGEQGWRYESHEMLAWAVHDGDVGSPIPEPASLGLVLASLAALGLSRLLGLVTHAATHRKRREGATLRARFIEGAP